MNVSAEFKLEPPFKVLNVRFVRILTRDDDLLGLRVGRGLVGLGPDWLRRKCGGR